MRILIIGLNFYPELTGIGKYTGEMAEFLAQNGCSVRVITAPPYYPQWKISKPYVSWRYQPESWSGVRIIRCPLWIPKKLSGLKRLIHLFSFAISSFFPAMNQTFWKPDIVMAIAPSILSAIPAILLSKLVSSKSWLHIQDFELDAAFGLGLLKGSDLVYKLAAQIECILIRQFDRVSTISNRMVERLLEKGLSKEKSVLFPNWIDTNLIHPLENSRFRKEWGFEEHKTIVLYSGNMGEKQGLDIVLKAAQLTDSKDNINFVLCGEGAVKYSLEQMAKGIENVWFYPLQPLGRLNDLLNLADIHILPQRVDAADLVMPSKLSGMLASGKVVVTTAHPESELGTIVAQVGVLSPPGDYEVLAFKMSELAQNPEQRKRLGKKGRAWLVDHWSRDIVLPAFLAHLKYMLES